MENSLANKSINGDFLSQSYSKGIERITGTEDHTVNFQIPKEILENRIKTWDHLFDKYSEMSDDIEINVETLEPEEKEEFSEEEYSYGQRIPMRKPATLVQYWIDTGNTPYNVYPDKEELSYSGSSLSEKEISSLPYSLLSNKVNDNKHKCKNDTSFSSVDTAAYILSNANVTKKADTLAIIEGAKSNGIKSLEDDYVKDVEIVCNDKTNCTETVATDYLMYNESSNDVSYNRIFHPSLMSNLASDNNQLVTSTIISTNIVQPDVSSQNSRCDKIDKTNILSANQKNVDLHNIKDIVNIFQQFNEASKRLSIDDKSNDTLSENKTLKQHSSEEKQINTMDETVKKDANLVAFHRKKLYTGRNSPVDLISIERDSSDLNKSRSSNTKLSLHPALDLDSSVRSESLVYKDKSKRYLSSKKALGPKKVQARKVQKNSLVSSKNITVDEADVTNNNTLDSTVDKFCSSQNLSSIGSSNNVAKRNGDDLIKKDNDINKSMKNVTQKYPVVYLERITYFKGEKPNSIKNEDVTQENSGHNDPVARLHTYEVENLESVADSDLSTILICECNNVSQDSSSISSSFHLRLSAEDDCSVVNAKKGDSKSMNLKNAAMNQNVGTNKKTLVILERLPQPLDTQSQALSKYDVNKKAAVILKRLSQSTLERYTKATRVLNINDNLPTNTKKSKMTSSNSHGTNIKNDVKLREIKIILKRLSADTYIKRNNNVTSKLSSSAVKNTISQGASMNSNRRKRKRAIKSLDNENRRTTQAIHKINDNYSSKRRTRSITRNDQTNNTSDDVVQHDDQISNETELSWTFRRKNHGNQVRQDKRRKFSGFISSNEDDLVQLIRSKKRLKTQPTKTSKTHIAEKDIHDEATLVSTNKDKYDSNRNISATNYSSKQNLRKIHGSIQERNRQNDIEVKSCGNDVTSIDSPLYKHKKLSLFLRRSNQCDSTIKNSNGRPERYLFSSTKNINNNSEGYPSKTTKENRLNCRSDTCVTLFQTKTFNIESSDSDNNNDITSIRRKSLRSASTRDKARFNGRANKKELCNDFYGKMHADKQSNSLNSSIERYDTADKTHYTRKRLRSSIGKVAKKNEQFDKKFNNNISLRTDTTTLYLPVASNTRNTLAQTNNTMLNSVSRSNNFDKLLRNRHTPKKSNQANQQQRDVKSTVNKLTFQTKSYYDSDSSG